MLGSCLAVVMQYFLLGVWGCGTQEALPRHTAQRRSTDDYQPAYAWDHRNGKHNALLGSATESADVGVLKAHGSECWHKAVQLILVYGEYMCTLHMPCAAVQPALCANAGRGDATQRCCPHLGWGVSWSCHHRSFASIGMPR